MRQLPGNNPHARIPHHKTYAFFMPRHGKGEPSALRHGVQRVEAKIQQGLPHTFRIDHSQRYARGHPAFHLNTAFFCILPDKAHNVFHHIGKTPGPGADIARP